MAVEFDLTETIDAPKGEVMAFFMKVEDIPKQQPKMAKKMEIMEKSDTMIKYRLEGKVMFKKIETVNQLSIDMEKGQFVTETLEGDGKGSKITMIFTEKDGKTEMNLKGTMELGALGSLGKGKVTSMWKEAMDQAKQVLEKK